MSSEPQNPPMEQQQQHQEQEEGSTQSKKAAKLEKLRLREEKSASGASAADAPDPLAANYGDVPLEDVQSKAVSGRKWIEIANLNEELKGQNVLIRGQAHAIRSVEIQVKKLYCISKAVPALPINIDDAARGEIEIEKALQAGKQLVRVNQDTRLNFRVLDLRTPANQGIFRVQCQVENIFRQFLLADGFVGIHTPKLIGGSSEGGSAVFKLDYKGQPACLAQSPQLHKQLAICGDFGRVFEIGPVFRAEDSYTHRHLCMGLSSIYSIAIRWLSVRPFYTMPCNDDPAYSNSFYVFIRGEEIISGAQRVHVPEFLATRAEACGIDVKTISTYIDSFGYGAPLHGGFGVGLERVVMLFCALNNIRKTSLFPRDPLRIAP
ncbi:Aspartate--tRNA ligase 1, cytoplasmic [Camellia lanceoleosa]|uniref:Aspartate--tRNA ligase 1, cytoplasmic n=1 Tax=Camellia lanceoleosa TaxID=1840588 RepID=A0ACC0ICU0_9ERIC|nr:Aspartate--tRNA ligase 1, cytoplasmic [Camellia lanceoleosa]